MFADFSTCANGTHMNVAPAFCDEILMGVSSDKTQSMKDVLSNFITNHLDYQQAKAQSIAICGTYGPVDKLVDFMDVPDEPTSSPCYDLTMGNAKKTKAWSAYEDRRLISAMHRFGSTDWTKISEFVGNGRNRNQCSQRWMRSLNPIINKNQWSTDEDVRLINAVTRFGDRSWTKVAAEIQGRTDVQCRYRYQIIGKKYPRALGIEQSQFFSQCYHLPVYDNHASYNYSPVKNVEEVKPEVPIIMVKQEPAIEFTDMWPSIHLLDIIKEVETDPTSFFNN